MRLNNAMNMENRMLCRYALRFDSASTVSGLTCP